MTKKSTSPFRIANHKIRWLLVFAIISFVISAWLLFQQGQKQGEARYWVEHTNRAINKVDSIRILLSESETITRNYIITREPYWSARLKQLHPHINQTLHDFQLYTEDNPEQQETVKRIITLVAGKLAFQNSFLESDKSIEENLKGLKQDGDGTKRNQLIELDLRKSLAIEKKLLAIRTDIYVNTNTTSSKLILIIGLFSVILVLVIIFRLNEDNSLKKKAEEDVVISEAKYRKLIENAGVVMYTTNPVGIINFVNNKVTSLTGYTVEELQGKHFSVLLDAKDVNQVVNFYVSQFTSKTSSTLSDFPIKTKQGETKWVEQSAQLLMEEGEVTGFQCMVTDITEKKKVQEELNKSELRRKENEYRLNAIMDNSIALIYIKDLQGRYVMANRKFKDFFGLSDEMVIGMTDFDFNPKEKAEHYKKLDQEILDNLQPIESEEVLETHLGTRILLLLKFPLISPEGTLLGISGIASDITEKVEMQKQLIASLKKAETATQIQEQFLANMSHEIRTPMNGIQGMARLLLETKLTDEQKKFTNMITRSLNNLVLMVNNVLDFSNLKAGKLTLDSFVFDLTEILDEVKKQFDKDINTKGLLFRITIRDDVPRFVKGDSRRIRQILANLVGNAVKFTNAGSITLEVGLLRQTENKATLHFVLTDTGIGIPENKLETIFESFAQAEKKISSGYGGAGLGLTISKGLIELLGGSIQVKSENGKGATFSFDITLDITKSEDRPASNNDYAERLKGKKILVVEDNMVNQMLVGFVLKKVNIVPDMAANGKEAIRLCEKQTYDLIIMDLQMPEMDGYETTLYLRNQLKINTPIIAMTATALLEDQEKSAKVGMNDFMIKPFDFTDLYTRLIRLLFNEGAAPVEIKDEVPQEEALYDLTLLEELGDKNAILEVLNLFFENTPNEMKQLLELSEKNDQESLYKLAHKLKSAVAMVQSEKLRDLLKNIEMNAKEAKNIEESREMVKEVQQLFARLEVLLRKEMKTIQDELS
ncbi:MAG: PAS domain S-box protein [Bacteroidota bacterium]|nr:PAS domain S-box protein [Bacteroidota bacterium]